MGSHGTQGVLRHSAQTALKLVDNTVSQQKHCKAQAKLVIGQGQPE